MAEPEWTLRDAKNKFSAVAAAAVKGTPQHVTRRGPPAVVVVSVSTGDRPTRNTRRFEGSFARVVNPFGA